jgi:hypothetical protein
MHERHPISPLLLALLVYALHCALFASWLIDDAGITYAYSRNLANGFGLVSQPGMAPVEGFSNALWTLSVSALYALGLFHVPWTPKILGVLLVAAAFSLIWRDLSARGASRIAVAMPLCLTAACTPFVIWTTSGLENPLLAFLVLLSCTLTLRAIGRTASQPWLDATAGVVAGLAALTRPDALLYAPAYPLLIAAAEMRSGSFRPLLVLRRWITVVAGFVPVYVSYLAFRVTYFGEWVPNTYFAKPKPSAGALLNPGKLLDLIESGTGDFLWVAVAFVAATLALLTMKRALTLRAITLLAYTGIASTSYVLMPNDWMGEFRFATSFFPLLYWTLAELALTADATLRLPAAPMRAWRTAVAVFAVQALVIFAARSVTFAADPPVPLDDTLRLGGHGFNRLAATLPVRDASLLTPDLGGVLLESKLRVIDLAGLCDPTIARTQSIGGDVSALHHYVFETVKPTFIHTSGTFQRTSRLHEDPRFERDYVALHESRDAPPEWASFWRGRARTPPWWADYVRRDALAGDASRLDALRAVYQAEQLASFAPWRRPQDRLRTGWPQVAWATATLRRHLRTQEPALVTGVRHDPRESPRDSSAHRLQ